MESLDALIGFARAQMNDARRALAGAETRHARALSRLADLEDGVAMTQIMASRSATSWPAVYSAYALARAKDRRALSADEAAFAREAEALRARLRGGARRAQEARTLGRA